MRYTATLDGRQIGKGTLQDVQTAVSTAVTDLVGQDPIRYAEDAQRANRAFSEGRVAGDVATLGRWSLMLDEIPLQITKEGR